MTEFIRACRGSEAEEVIGACPYFTSALLNYEEREITQREWLWFNLNNKYINLFHNTEL